MICYGEQQVNNPVQWIWESKIAMDDWVLFVGFLPPIMFGFKRVRGREKKEKNLGRFKSVWRKEILVVLPVTYCFKDPGQAWVRGSAHWVEANPLCQQFKDVRQHFDHTWIITNFFFVLSFLWFGSAHTGSAYMLAWATYKDTWHRLALLVSFPFSNAGFTLCVNCESKWWRRYKCSR